MRILLHGGVSGQNINKMRSEVWVVIFKMARIKHDFDFKLTQNSCLSDNPSTVISHSDRFGKVNMNKHKLVTMLNISNINDK